MAVFCDTGQTIGSKAAPSSGWAADPEVLRFPGPENRGGDTGFPAASWFLHRNRRGPGGVSLGVNQLHPDVGLDLLQRVTGLGNPLPAGYPMGRIDGVGIKPDLEVLLTEDYLKNPTLENDSQYQAAIKYLED